jgi:NitT/TauT family transport system substrate-binding protein
MRTPRQIGAIALALCLALAVGGCKSKPKTTEPARPAAAPAPAPKKAPPAKPEPKLQKLNLGFAIPSWVHAVVWVTEDKGFFKKHGLEVKLFQMKGSSASMQGLLSGDLDVALAGGDAMIRANLAGADLVLFGGVVNRHYHRLVTRKGIEKPEDLKGRSVGLPFMGGPQDMAVKAALQRFKLGYNKDVAIKNMGAEYARLASLTKGDVDAVTSAAPPSVLEKLGLHVLADLPSWEVPFPYMQMIAKRSFLKDRKDVALAFVRALSEGIRFYKENRDESIAIVEKQLGSKKGAPTEAYDTRGPAHISYPPYPDMNGLKSVLESIAADDEKARSRKAEEWVDLEILDAVKADGGFAAGK